MASLQTCVGGGRVAPGRPKAICQIISSTARVMSGGSTATAVERSMSPRRADMRVWRDFTAFAGATAEAGVVVSVFMAAMLMG